MAYKHALNFKLKIEIYQGELNNNLFYVNKKNLFTMYKIIKTFSLVKTVKIVRREKTVN